MQISRPEFRRERGRARVSATIVWEERAHPPFEAYFETDEPFGESLAAEPNAFLTAAFVPALYHGERRIAIDGPVCPVLERGLAMSAQVLQQWYGAAARQSKPRIESVGRAPPPRTATARGAAIFLSGGVDSAHALWRNRQDYADDHPASFRDAIYAYGIDMAGVRGRDRSAIYDAGWRALQPVCAATRIDLIPLRTNIKLLDDRFDFFIGWSAGSLLASIAHVLGMRICSAAIAASIGPSDQLPWGTHPLLDPHFGSAHVAIQHVGAELQRWEKVRDLLGWPAMLERLRVCYRYDQMEVGEINCGRCTKCLHTMLAIVAAGGDLSQAPSFPQRPLTEQLVRDAVVLWDEMDVRFLKQLIGPLRAAGRDDLAEAIRRKLRSWRRHLIPGGALHRLAQRLCRWRSS